MTLGGLRCACGEERFGWVPASKSVRKGGSYTVTLAHPRRDCVANVCVEAWAYRRDAATGLRELVTLLSTSVTVLWEDDGGGFRAINSAGGVETGGGDLEFEIRVDAASGRTTLFLRNSQAGCLGVISRHIVQGVCM
jgi:hypothetical protein